MALTRECTWICPHLPLIDRYCTFLRSLNGTVSKLLRTGELRWRPAPEISLETLQVGSQSDLDRQLPPTDMCRRAGLDHGSLHALLLLSPYAADPVLSGLLALALPAAPQPPARLSVRPPTHELSQRMLRHDRPCTLPAHSSCAPPRLLP